MSKSNRTTLRFEKLEARDVPAFLAPATSDGTFDAVGDFNGDGTADLVVADTVAGRVSIRLGNGDGTFQPADPTVAVAGRPQAVADFDGDGNMDVLLLTSGPLTGTSRVGQLAMLGGNGDGSLRNAVITSAAVNNSYRFTNVQVADLNGDGRPDVVAKHYFNGGPTGNSTRLQVLTAQTDGTFAVRHSELVGFSSRSGTQLAPAVHIGDIDGDGDADVLTLARTGSNPYPSRVLVNDGTGRLAVGSNVTGFNGASVTLAQLDGDGKVDLIRDNGDGTSTVFLGTGKGKFNQKASVALSGSPVVADVNGDGKADLIGSDTAAGTVRAFLGNANGTFQSARMFPAGAAPLGVCVGDFDGDGRIDLALPNSDRTSISVLLNDGVW